MWCSILTWRRHWLELDRDRATSEDTIWITTTGVYLQERYTQIFTHHSAQTSKHFVHSLLSEIRWTISLRLALGEKFLPADCKNRYVTTQHLMEVWGKEEKIEIRFPTAPLPSPISVDISECFISCQNVVWKRATDTAVLGCGKQIWMCLMLSGLFEKFQPKHE